MKKIFQFLIGRLKTRNRNIKYISILKVLNLNFASIRMHRKIFTNSLSFYSIFKEHNYLFYPPKPPPNPIGGIGPEGLK